MASVTAPIRSGRSRVGGSSKDMPASRIFAFTRTSRWLMAAGEMRSAPAIVAASSPEWSAP